MPAVRENAYAEIAETSLAGSVRLARQASNVKPQACQYCQKRKRKCDGQRPTCSTCQEKCLDCAYDLRITDKSHPNFLSDMVTKLAEQTTRVGALEKVLDTHIPSLGPVAQLSTEQLLAMTPVESSQHPVHSLLPLPFYPVLSPQVLTSELQATLCQRLSQLEIGKRSKNPPLVVNMISSKLGNTQEQEQEQVTRVAGHAVWPPQPLAVKFAKMYHEMNAMYPCVRLATLMEDLDKIYAHNQPDLTATPHQTARLFLVFSLGCLWLEQTGNNERIDVSPLRDRAIACLPDVFKGDALDSVEVLILLALSALHDWGSLDVMDIVPVVVDLVYQLDLNKHPPAHLSETEKNRRRVLFCCAYLLERLIGACFHSPVELNDWDVQAQIPSQLEHVGSLGEGVDPLNWFRHIVQLRSLGWEVCVLSERSAVAEAEILRLHRRIDDWLANAPRPRSTDYASATVLFGDSFFDLWYNILLTDLYRPAAVRPNDNPERVATLRRSSSRAIAIYVALHQQRKIVENYVHFHCIIVLGMTLLFAITKYDGNRENVKNREWREAAVREITACQDLVGSICPGWPYTKRLSFAFRTHASRAAEGIVNTYDDPVVSVSVQPQQGATVGGTQTGYYSNNSSAAPILNTYDPAPVTTNVVNANDFVPFSAENNELWSLWGQENFSQLPSAMAAGAQTGSPETVDFQELLASLGLSTQFAENTW